MLIVPGASLGSLGQLGAWWGLGLPSDSLLGWMCTWPPFWPLLTCIWGVPWLLNATWETDLRLKRGMGVRPWGGGDVSGLE